MAQGRVSAEQHRVVVDQNLEMIASDGTVLRADVFRPDAPGRFPVLLMRTPYGKSHKGQLAQNSEVQYFPQRGYVVVIQDVRGRGVSDGLYYPFLREGRDSYDAVEWAAALPWSNGMVGTIGQSYLASVQYAGALLAPPHLRAMCPVAGAAGHFHHSIFRRGVFELRWRLAYFTAMERVSYHRAGAYRDERDRLDSYVEEPRALLSLLTDEAYRDLPLRVWGERLQGQEPYLREIMDHSVDGSFWDESDVVRHPESVDVPAFHVSSWYDAFQSDILGAFNAFRKCAATEEARAGQRLMMGPWAHLEPYSVPTSGGTGDVDFGPDAIIDLHGLQLRWFDRWLKGVDDGDGDVAAVRLFVMGTNRWRDESDWPLARAVERRLFLRSGGHANSLAGDGTLSWEAPNDEAEDQFVYDPADPVPTTGGTIIGHGGGVYDQRRVEARPDVLVYTGGVLHADLEITGNVHMELWAATSAVDTDFTAKLVDVHPDGLARNVVEGVVRARFRDSLTEPTPVTPGQIYRFDIDLWATSHVFLAGHRLRLEVSSSNFPRYDRNAGSGLPFGEDTVLHRAEQRVFHDVTRPSAVILPTIPGVGA